MMAALGVAVAAAGLVVSCLAIMAAWTHGPAMDDVRAEEGYAEGVLRVTSVIGAAVIALVLWVGMLMIRAGMLWVVYA